MEWLEKNKYALGLLLSIVVAGAGLYMAEQFEENFMSGLGLMALGGVGAIIFGILANRKGKGSPAARFGTGFGVGMAVLAILAALTIAAFVAWVFLTFGLG